MMSWCYKGVRMDESGRGEADLLALALPYNAIGQRASIDPQIWQSSCGGLESYWDPQSICRRATPTQRQARSYPISVCYNPTVASRSASATRTTLAVQACAPRPLTKGVNAALPSSKPAAALCHVRQYIDRYHHSNAPQPSPTQSLGTSWQSYIWNRASFCIVPFSVFDILTVCDRPASSRASSRRAPCIPPPHPQHRTFLARLANIGH